MEEQLLARLELGHELSVIEGTGEMVLLSEASNDALARWLHQYKVARDVLQEAKQQVDAEFVRRADHDAVYHVDVEGVGRVMVDGPKDQEVWNTQMLKDTLSKLVTEGEISQKAADNAIEEVVTLKVKAAGINALRKLGGHVQQSVDACRELHPKARYASLKQSNSL